MEKGKAESVERDGEEQLRKKRKWAGEQRVERG